MKTLRILIVLTLMSWLSYANAVEGMIEVKSAASVKETMNRMEKNVKKRGMKVFARIDHAEGAAKVGKTMRATELLIFGNPKGGTPFMECAQTVGIDLPLKALVWEDGNSQVWLAYNDPAYIAQRHGVAQCSVVKKLSKALSTIVAEVVSQ